jgi:hypothetical protein
VNSGLGFGRNLVPSRTVAGHQLIEVVTVRSVSAEGLLIEQAFDAAAEANLVGAILEANRPTHFAVPAATKDHYSGRPQTRGNHEQRPQPTRLLFLFTHLRQPVNPSKTQGYAQSHGRATGFGNV